jgi:hypothetical protein
MSSRTNQRKEWEITILRVDGIRTIELERINIPCHKLNDEALNYFLKALLAKHTQCDASHMFSFFVNDRKGYPRQQTQWEPKEFFDFEQMKCGVWCAQGQICAVASLPMSQQVAEFIKEQRRIFSGAHNALETL